MLSSESACDYGFGRFCLSLRPCELQARPTLARLTLWSLGTQNEAQIWYPIFGGPLRYWTVAAHDLLSQSLPSYLYSPSFARSKQSQPQGCGCFAVGLQACELQARFASWRCCVRFRVWALRYMPSGLCTSDPVCLLAMLRAIQRFGFEPSGVHILSSQY